MAAFKATNKQGKTTWTAKFYYTDWTGERKQKKKEGFSTQREAKAFEHDFLERVAPTPSMSFSALCDLYLDDLKTRTKITTSARRKSVIENHMRPAFSDTPINEIKPANIRKWQESMLDKGIALSTLKTYHGLLSSMFNYAVKFHKLPQNPARIAGNIGKVKKRLAFWTPAQFRQFIFTLPKCESHRHDGTLQKIALFETLFWTGARIGEILALTVADVDIKKELIDINKTFVRVDGQDIIQPPKTPKSKRKVLMPPVLVDILADWIKRTGLRPRDRLFSYKQSVTAHTMKICCERAGLPPLTPHGLRHSHASLLIELKAPILAISERLGHDSVQTTLNIYAHLFPNKQKDVIDLLQASPL